MDVGHHDWGIGESEEVVREGGKGASFCGIVIEEITDGYFLHQRPYTKELIKKLKLGDCNATKIILDKESEDALIE